MIAKVEVLKPNDRVIVDGLQRVRPGVKVEPKLVDMATLLVKAEPEPKKVARPSPGKAEGRPTRIQSTSHVAILRWNHPIFAMVVSIVIVIAGAACVVLLPIAQYPPIVPPTVQVTATYPGASAETVAATVGQPIEEQINGVEGMIYMSSTCTNNGLYMLTVSFEVGTDIHTALMLTQIRVQLAMPQLPPNVQKEGVNVQMKSPNILLTVNLISPDGRYNALYLSNYAQINLFDDLSRLPGVGLVTFLGQRQYSMRAWLDPQKLAALHQTTGEVEQAIREQNGEVASGNIGQQPVPKGQSYQLVLNSLGRLTTEQQFGDIIVKVGQDGRYVRLRDVARLQLGAQNSDIGCTLADVQEGKVVRHPSVALCIYSLPDANALDVAGRVKKKMEQLAKRFPQGLEYSVAYDTTPFIKQSVMNVVITVLIAALLVIIVVLVFIQEWHAVLLPMFNMVVALVGTICHHDLAMGFSLNNLSLFGLVLAVGIVVDDSIVLRRRLLSPAARQGTSRRHGWERVLRRGRRRSRPCKRLPAQWSALPWC